MSTIQFINLYKQYLSIADEIDIAIRNVLRSGNFIMGKNVGEFEKQIASYCGSKYAVGVASGTDALLLSLLALGIKDGDEVITTPFTFIASANTIVRAGGKPVFIDVDEETFNINISEIESKITSKTKAIVLVHLFGYPMDMFKVIDIAQKHNLYIIEDAAQAIGAKINQRSVGSFGDTAAISFFPSKNLGAYGDGGIVLTDNDGIRDQIDLLRHHGAKNKYYHEIIGVNSRLDEIQAAILRVKLKYLDAWNNSRRERAKLYTSTLKNSKLILPIEKTGVFHTYHQFTIRVLSGRDELKSFLFNQGIDTKIYYPHPLHLQPAFQYLGYRSGDFPVAEKLCTQVLSLPCYPELSILDQEKICQAIITYLDKNYSHPQ